MPDKNGKRSKGLGGQRSQNPSRYRDTTGTGYHRLWKTARAQSTLLAMTTTDCGQRDTVFDFSDILGKHRVTSMRTALARCWILYRRGLDTPQRWLSALPCQSDPRENVLLYSRGDFAAVKCLQSCFSGPHRSSEYVIRRCGPIHKWQPLFAGGNISYAPQGWRM